MVLLLTVHIFTITTKCIFFCTAEMHICCIIRVFFLTEHACKMHVYCCQRNVKTCYRLFYWGKGQTVVVFCCMTSLGQSLFACWVWCLCARPDKDTVWLQGSCRVFHLSHMLFQQCGVASRKTIKVHIFGDVFKVFIPLSWPIQI